MNKKEKNCLDCLNCKVVHQIKINHDDKIHPLKRLKIGKILKVYCKRDMWYGFKGESKYYNVLPADNSKFMIEYARGCDSFVLMD